MWILLLYLVPNKKKYLIVFFTCKKRSGEGAELSFLVETAEEMCKSEEVSLWQPREIPYTIVSQGCKMQCNAWFNMLWVS